MKETARKLRWGFYGALPIAAWLAYRAISQNPGQPGWVNCLLIYFVLTILVLVYYTGCVVNCGPENEPLDPACVRKCFRQFLYIELVLIALLFACIGGSQL